MKRISFIAICFCLAVSAFLTTAAISQAAPRTSRDGVWTRLPASQAAAAAQAVPLVSGRPMIFRMRMARLRALLGRSPAVLSLPLPDGRYTRLRLRKTALLSPAARRGYPGISTWRGQGIDDPTVTARLDITSRGFHAQLIGAFGTVLIDPVGKSGKGLYQSYWEKDVSGRPTPSLPDAADPPPGIRISPTLPSGDRLRTYRLAVTATGEYTVFFGGDSQAAAAVATTFNRVIGIYERELDVSFTIAALNIYPDPATDPFPTGGVVDANLLDQNQADLDARVGPANYDIGFIVTQGGSGRLAEIGVVCNDASKARGGASLGNPAGDAFDVDYVAHEIGHQSGGYHTFNGTTGACGDPGQRAADSAYEPGSGSTIMGFPGLCGAENVQAQADAYFHTASYGQIAAFRDGPGATCGAETLTGNGAPIVDAGADWTVPRETPFTLTASGSDPDGDPLTFCWEEFDLGAATPPPNMADGPLFRSRPPVADPSRTLPRMADLLAGSTPWERPAAVDRLLTFRVTARDNRAGGGGVDYDTMTVNVAGDPFAITAPAAGARLECGGPSLLAWNVGGGSIASEVQPLISTDGGASFSDLPPAVPNTGSADFTVPRVLSPEGRIKLDAVGNIFFALSGQFSIADTLPPVLTLPADIPDAQCSSPAGTPVDIGTATATDQCDAAPVVANNAPSLFPLGTTGVTWTATDASSNQAQGIQLVTVVDTIPPSITAPPDVTAECTSPLGTPVALGTPLVSDICDAAPLVGNNAPALFPLGTTIVVWTATDASLNQSEADQSVLVVDTIPPVLQVTLSPSMLWPPNHKMAVIRAAIVVTDICDASPTVQLVSIASNEPDNGLGDGNTVNDIQGASFGTDDREFQLRAERSGTGTGRIYTVTYRATDASGNSTVQQAFVIVPHDMGSKSVAGIK